MYYDFQNVYLVLEYQGEGSLLSKLMKAPANNSEQVSKYQRPLNENQVKLIMT
jgi:hypothetical protein